ncbi:UPF0481 protein At3g47200-like [Syzygium oleosum]|uniref:UPF0481 protein At3g47200-like n=1 Tax=Syzygium oleosum TaxID=219896 RepID=UPI0011D22C1D|nr:UPF0481 protein At3g47200-like [Syzygium oleosum]
MDNNRGGRQATAEEHEIELVKLLSLASMSEAIEAAPKWLNESTGESSCCIFRIPQGFAGGYAEACRPQVVSIGPYHHGEPQLQMLEQHKWGCLRTMLDQTQPHSVSLKDLIDVVAPKEKMIRQCYFESTDNFSGSDLVKMMVLDGCFIIQYLRQMAGGLRTNPPLRNSYVLESVMRDLLRLENQVPYFVLEDLFEMTDVPKGNFSLASLVFQFFNLIPEVFGKVQERRSNQKVVHLLDSFRLCFIPSDQKDIYLVDTSTSESDFLIKSACELRRVGIGFKQREASTILEIKFDSKHRTIEIPKITIDGDLKWILSNMIAFEQCRGQEDGHVTAYAAFMGCLIHTADDVQLLRDRKVISNHGMSNEEVSHFFGDVCKGAAFDSNGCYLASHCVILNKSLKYEWAYLCCAQLRNAFHDNPWSALSGLAVLVTLIGMIQTVYAVLQYYHPK